MSAANQVLEVFVAVILKILNELLARRPCVGAVLLFEIADEANDGRQRCRCSQWVHCQCARRTPNNHKLSDTPERRGTCTVGGKAVAEAGAVTRRRVAAALG